MIVVEQIDWSKISAENLKSEDDLERSFRLYLKRECHYSPDAAKFTADIIRNPYGKGAGVEKQYVSTAVIDSKDYEVYFCTVEDSSPVLFKFYMLVDLVSLRELENEDYPYSDKTWRSYLLAKKKYVIPKNNKK